MHLEKTIAFILLIFLGVLLKKKLDGSGEINGIKKIILNVALPATIFLALVSSELKSAYLYLPFLALLLNFLLFWIMPFLLPLIGIEKSTPGNRTARLLMPSLAPGLSCFPFILEYLGEEHLAKAAMADLGNKFFVLVFLYALAIKWHIKISKQRSGEGISNIGKLVKVLFTEPVTILLLLGIFLVTFGKGIESFPVYIAESLQRLSLMMTPLILLYIGLAVKFDRRQFWQISNILISRAGVVFILAGLFVMVTGMSNNSDVMLLLVFSLSACSFWPFAHISLVDKEENHLDFKLKTFDVNFAIGIIAVSFPLSTSMNILILTANMDYTKPSLLMIIGGLMISFSLIVYLANKVSRSRYYAENKTSKDTEYAESQTYP